jgi:hypothetical protein
MSAPTVREDRRWYYLALRHLRMGRRLLRSGFADGAAFHGYHCYECLLSAVIAAKGYPVPPEGWTKLELPTGRTIEAYPSPSGSIQERNAHKARIVFFDELADPGRRYFALHRLLRTFLTYQDRLDALYYDPGTDRLPQDRYSAAYAVGLLSTLWQFAREVRSEIP